MIILVLEYWAPLLVWLMTIFFFSTDAFSSSETSKIIVPILTFLFPHVPAHQIEVWHSVIRKCGHVAEFFILALLAYRTVRLNQPDPRGAKLRTAFLVTLVALLDELHQRFTASRGASIIDVAYDCLGAVWALSLITGYETWRLRSRSVL